MRSYYSLVIFFFFISLVSCEQYTAEKNCFEENQDKNISYKEFEPDAPEKIIKANPDHVKFTVHNNVVSFEDNNKETMEDLVLASEKAWKKAVSEYNNRFRGLIRGFGNQFNYIATRTENNIISGVGENQFGYWFLEIRNNIPDAYYLGLSQYTFINKKQPEDFMKGNTLILHGNFIRVSKSWGYPFYPPFEAVKDHLVFKIDLRAVKKDTDKDRFNDLFEKLILLNPGSSDTDNDGIPDLVDINPLYRQEKSKFTDLYSRILDNDVQYQDFSKCHYSFTGYFSDCEYFQKVMPTRNKVLIYPEKERYHLKSDYKLAMFPRYLGKIKKGEDLKTFYVNYGSGAGGGYYKAIYEKERWKISKLSTHVI